MKPAQEGNEIARVHRLPNLFPYATAKICCVTRNNLAFMSVVLGTLSTDKNVSVPAIPGDEHEVLPAREPIYGIDYRQNLLISHWTSHSPASS